MKKMICLMLAWGILLLTGCGADSASAPALETSEPAVVTETAEAAPKERTVQTEPEESQPDTNDNEESEDQQMENLEISINGKAYSAVLYDNDAAAAFKSMLPVTLSMSELNGNEKYCYLKDSLPTDSSVPSGIHTGDLMLFGSDCLVLFYEDFSTSYSYTTLGHLNDPEGLSDALGSGNVHVTFQVRD